MSGAQRKPWFSVQRNEAMYEPREDRPAPGFGNGAVFMSRDELGGVIAHDPLATPATALKPFSGEGLMKLFRTHPPSSEPIAVVR